jgi:hypothetical protein
MFISLQLIDCGLCYLVKEYADSLKTLNTMKVNSGTALPDGSPDLEKQTVGKEQEQGNEAV